MAGSQTTASMFGLNDKFSNGQDLFPEPMDKNPGSSAKKQPAPPPPVDHIGDFLQAFSGNPKFCLSFPFLWTVTIEGIYTSNVNTVLQNAGETWSLKLDPTDMTKGGTLLPAQNVTIPNEASSFSAMGMGDTGGFLPGYALNTRADFLSRSFAIGFLETARDLEHEFFRPWMIAIGIQGLVQDPNTVLRGTITVKQFNNKGVFRKGFKFKKAFPTNVEGFTLNYENTDFPIKHVTFACENYEQL